MDVARMREAGVCTPEGKCILCNNRVSGDTHACPWRGITDVTFDFTALHPLERPLPEHPDPNAATRRHRLEVQARHRYLQGKVVFVMPQVGGRVGQWGGWASGACSRRAPPPPRPAAAARPADQAPAGLGAGPPHVLRGPGQPAPPGRRGGAGPADAAAGGAAV